MKKTTITALLVLISIGVLRPDVPEVRDFFLAAGRDSSEADAALERIGNGWDNSYTGMMLDLARFMKPAGSPHPSSRIRSRLTGFLKKVTGEKFGDNLAAWRRWLWKQKISPHRDLVYFKSKLYSAVDPEMALFFTPGMKTLIRLDEIDWGGVKVNGIPPLYFPRRIPGDKAQYLAKKDIVFGIYFRGKARAYPKRILAWHEMALDRIGNVPVTLVYCTLCGAAIPFISQVSGRDEKFGTSGLLYRSNKLMFDFSSRSLWSSLSGEPVTGPLAGKGIRLKEIPVVMTTWGEWKKAHPDTEVLSPDTGFSRDYREGAAYRDYFSHHRLMFPVPETKKELKNKEVVLAMKLPRENGTIPAAIRSKLLKKKRIYHPGIRGQALVILTTPGGASRVYSSGGTIFTRLKGPDFLLDNSGGVWKITEEFLMNRDSGKKLERIPAHNAFWFGWKARYPGTLLFK